MEANQETNVVTTCATNELIKDSMEGDKPVKPANVMGTDNSESSSNCAATASEISSFPANAENGHPAAGDGASCSTLRVKPPPPFLLKVYDIVSNPETDPIISWNSSGTSLIVWDPHKFAAEVLGKFFRHNNFSSFVCQLNTYGFKKINWERMEFQNEWFQKGKRRWLNRIKRRNQSTENYNKQPLYEKQKELETSMQEHEALKTEMMELIRKQESLEKEMSSLEKRAQGSLCKRQKILNHILREVFQIGEKSNPRKEELPRAESDAKNSSSSAELSIPSQAKAKCMKGGLNLEYTLLEKQLMDDLNLEKLSEEERAKLQPDIFIGLEDLMAGPADWTEFAKDVESQARNLGSKS